MTFLWQDQKQSGESWLKMASEYKSTRSPYRVIWDLYRVYTEQVRATYHMESKGLHKADAGSTESTADNNGKKLEYVNFS